MEKLSNPQRTIEVIKKYEFCFQKKFGQKTKAYGIGGILLLISAVDVVLKYLA